MTWGHVFIICICWIVGVILINRVLHLLDKRMHFQNHEGWNDLGRAIMTLLLIGVPPAGFIVGYLGYRTYLFSPKFLLILLLSIPVVVFVIWRIYVYFRVKRPLKECRKECEGLKAAGAAGDKPSVDTQITKWIEEEAPEGGYPAFRDKYVKLWGNPYSYLVTEHYIQAEYIVSQITYLFFRLKHVYKFISLEEKKALVDAIIRYDQDRFPPITFRNNGFPEGSEKIVKWSYSEEEKSAGMMTYLYLTFGDGSIYILRLLWEGRVFNAVREKDTTEIERLKLKLMSTENSRIIEIKKE